MIKQKQQKLRSSLHSLFQSHYQIQVPSHIESILVNTSAHIETQNLSLDDIPHIKLLLTLKLSGITLKCSNTLIDKQLIPFIIKKVKFSQSGFHQLAIIDYKELNQFSKQVEVCLRKCKTIKEIKFINCNIDDELLAKVTYALETNDTLRSINFSGNKITKCDPVIDMLKQHDIFCREKADMLKLHLEEVYNQQIINLNLQNNQIDDKEAMKLAEYIKTDKLVKCLNLSYNKMTKQGLQSFSEALNWNKTILNLDLRFNDGSTIEISNLIFNKILKNMAQFKIKRSKNTKKQNSSIDFKTKKLKPNPQNLTFENHNNTISNNNHNTFIQIEQNQQYQNSSINCQNYSNYQNCENCKKLHSKVFKTQKKVLDYQLQNSKLKKILQNRGFEISMINPSNQQNQEISFNVKNFDSSSDDIVQKIQYMMLELTKILEAHQLQQNTQVDITHPIWTNHNLSNTVQILANNQHSIVVPLPEEEDQLSDIQS